MVDVWMWILLVVYLLLDLRSRWAFAQEQKKMARHITWLRTKVNKPPFTPNPTQKKILETVAPLKHIGPPPRFRDVGGLVVSVAPPTLATKEIVFDEPIPNILLKLPQGTILISTPEKGK